MLSKKCFFKHAQPMTIRKIQAGWSNASEAETNLYPMFSDYIREACSQFGIKFLTDP
jgi:hypothetical protein